MLSADHPILSNMIVVLYRTQHPQIIHPLAS